MIGVRFFKIWITFLLFSSGFIACTSDLLNEEEDYPEILLEVVIEEDYFFPNKAAFLIVSNLDGKIVRSIPLEAGMDFQVENTPEISNQAFHVSIASLNQSFSDTPPGIYQQIQVKTYSFVKPGKLQLKRNNSFNPFDGSTYASVEITGNLSGLRDSYISGTLTAYRNSTEVQRVSMKPGLNNIFASVQLQDLGQWKGQLIKDVAPTQSIEIKVEEMQDYPTQILTTPPDFEANLNIIGIVDYASNHFHSLQWNEIQTNGTFATRYLPETDTIFESYLSRLSLESEESIYRIEHFGAPLENYLPEAINFSVEQSLLSGFSMTSSNQFSTYQASWTNDVSQGAQELVNWEIWGPFPGVFRAPDLGELLQDTFPWYQQESLELVRVSEHFYSNYPDYKQWLAFQWSPEYSNRIGDDRLLQGNGYWEQKVMKY